MVGAKRIISEKMREDWYREGYARSLEGNKMKGMEIIMSSICGSR